MKIAIIGASKDKSKFGNKAVRAYKSKGWQVFPVNLKETEIEGLKCYKSVLDIEEDLDFVSVYLPPKIGLNVADEIIKKGVKKVYLNPGAESEELVEKLQKNGVKPLLTCSIKAIGIDPKEL